MITKVYLCPADKKYSCTWEGASDDIYEHFTQEHEDLLHLTNSVTVSLQVDSENQLLLFKTEIYLLQSKIIDEELKIFLRYLGPASIAANLNYEIELSTADQKVPKQDIETHDGYFSISLECLRSRLGAVDDIQCKLIIRGDFHPSSEPPKSPVSADESFNGSVVNLQDLFTQSYSPEIVETREKKHSLDDSYRSTWGGDNYVSSKASGLSRSQTFTPEDIKRHSGNFQRYASTRSLCSIAETDLDAELRCSNCDFHLSAPIFLCASGHNVCHQCYQNETPCTLCGMEITTNRNTDLETKSENHIYLCVNSKEGCNQKLPYPYIIEHEINCVLCRYMCPIDECGFKGAFKQMYNHLKLIHSSIKALQSFIATFEKHQEIFLLNERMGIFYCFWTQLNDKVIWTAKFCGPKEKKFFCELKFKKKTFKKPLLLTKKDDCYVKELSLAEMKEAKVKVKNSVLTVSC